VSLAILAVVAGILPVIGLIWLIVRIALPSRKVSKTPVDLPGIVPEKVDASETMAGGLQHMALADLLQFLAQGGHSGTLTVSSGRRTGSIRMIQGLVIHAEFRRSLDLDAMFELLSLEIGDFQFRFEAPPSDPVRGHEVVDILMLWLARKEDLK
jgi:hypothetical protein